MTLKTKRMLGIKGIGGGHLVLGLIALGVIYFVIKKKGGGGGGIISSGAPMGSYIPGSTTPLPLQQIYGLGQAGTEYLAEKPPLDLYDIYSGAVGDIQYVPSTADLIPYRKDSEPPYEYGWTYQPY